MHIGHNVEKLRKYRRISQKDMAKRLEMDTKQYTELVESEEMPDYILSKVAAELDFDADYIRGMETGAVTNNIQNINDSTTIHGGTIAAQVINPLDKIVELYEQLLKTEREKNAQLQQQLSARKD